ncbi:Olfactory receptor 7E24 [Heterocephalus glaber]|uniref:Olfactory receptor 7E24 n=1 Tax=Heterocephalus glaber TaxID=10181 RepID=G5C452_HETGA|nr:Olfactory receptor 7E24 [Heterocephalus glaber]
METYNLTSVSEFHLMGFSEDPDLQLVLFGLFLSMYLVTVLGNLLIIQVVISDFHLHTPMYFFLSNLSLSDICFISTTVPKMIVDILTHSRVISYVGCLTQMSFYTFFGCMDHMLLTVMGYDRKRWVSVNCVLKKEYENEDEDDEEDENKHQIMNQY